MLLAIVLMLYTHNDVRFLKMRIDTSAWRTWLPAIIASLYACKLALISHALYTERHSATSKRTIISALLILAFIPALFFLTKTPWLHMLFLAPGLLLLMMSAAYVGTKVDDMTYCTVIISLGIMR
ncbi:MAG: hypothetical protein J0M34_05475 [Alphaproteobacteria bacterium]|nr:hypothetical protein [Alphaproteobacteria bacterium]